jgi:hypothetical protein
MRAVLLCLALAACAPSYALSKPGRPVPTWRYAVDFAAIGAGLCVGMDAQYGGPSSTRDQRMAIGYGVALSAWAPYWAGWAP